MLNRRAKYRITKFEKSVIVIIGFIIVPVSLASAQLISNKPFSFKNSGNSSVGMSVGGKQAIINDKLLDSRPDNLLRSQSGELLNVQKGADGSAFVSYPGTGQFIPEYRGTSFKNGSPEMGVGVFNGFFVPMGGNMGIFYPQNSGVTVSTWTARVISGGIPVFYQGEDDAIETWTGNVFMMNKK